MDTRPRPTIFHTIGPYYMPHIHAKYEGAYGWHYMCVNPKLVKTKKIPEVADVVR